MQKTSGNLVFSPSDLVKFAESEFISWMDRFDIEYPGEALRDPESETEVLLKSKGILHEQAFLQELKQTGKSIVDVSIDLKESSELSSFESRCARTVAAMEDGADIIYQGALTDDQFVGYVDFLLKVDGNSRFGPYTYEPLDTKLAASERPHFLIQLCCYADLLRQTQGSLPERVHVVLGSGKEKSYRTADFYYYYREMRKALVAQQEVFDRLKPPAFVGMEDFGRWNSHIGELMEQRDHLSRVANIRTIQLKKLHQAGIETMSALANSKLSNIPKMKDETYLTLKKQAILQIASKGLEKPQFEVIAPQLDGQGLKMLPAASPLDVYFDMEGFPLIDGGLEYLFGVTYVEDGELKFKDWWAHNPQEEKVAFEDFITWVHERWKADHHMHIYHYAAYEKTAIRRLMGKYGTKEKEVDDLLRNEVLLDLFSVVRHAIKVGEPKYSIKNIEHLYKEKRAGDVATAMDSVIFYQRWLDNQDGASWQTSKILSDIRSYNKEDCDSTYALAEWLRTLQSLENIAPRVKQLKLLNENSSTVESLTEAAALAQELLAEIDANNLDEDSRVKQLLAHVLEFHRRELKPVFWAKYDCAAKTDAERYEEAICLANLERTSTPRIPVAKSFLYEYRYDPDQDTKIDAGNRCFFADDLTQAITVGEIDTQQGIIRLKKGQQAPEPPDRLSLIKDEFVDPKPIPEAVFKVVKRFKDQNEISPALRDFLYRNNPNVNGKKGSLIGKGVDLTEGTSQVVQNLQNSTLCIQGPPGAGKTYTAARAICVLIKTGKRVGVTSNSHKAILHLMRKVVEEAANQNTTIRAFKLQNDRDLDGNTQISFRTSAKFFDDDIDSFDLVGGTTWAFANTRAENLVDYLFVDEAGQVSIANLIGMAHSTSNFVLIGDQMQLAQPIQGSHPGDSGKSLLEYFLQDKKVVPEEQGIFLGKTWRMHPDVCSFISGAVYEDRLLPVPQTAHRTLIFPDNSLQKITKRSGLLFRGVEHEGNSQDSEEEIAEIVELVNELRKCDFGDGKVTRKITLDDILFVAPYNMQVRRLRSAIPNCRAGSVDRFQGQEAPIVVVSMCSSSGETSSRGLEFIFNKNRLNVAISRAQVLAVVVGSPSLARSKCSNVEQMELVNLFCRIQQHT